MKIFLPSILLFLSISLQAFSHDHQDSVNVDKKQMENVIREIRERHLEKWKAPEDFDIKDVKFVYPDKIIPGKGFDVSVIWKGEAILMCDVEVEDDRYTLGLIIDLR